MLHMVVNTHNAESCAFRGKEEEDILVGAFNVFEESARDNGMTVRGSYVNRAAHEVFLLVDASNAHVIEDALLEAGLVGRTHSRVVPIISLDEA